MENQRDATITVYWSPRSAQHVSGKLLPIFRSARLRFVTAYGIVACKDGYTNSYVVRMWYVVLINVIMNWWVCNVMLGIY
jgi:hypothetical protein